MSTAQYEEMRGRINKDTWLAEYMQQPVDLQGRLFSNLKMMPNTEFEQLKSKVEGYIGYIDVSDQGSDYTALAIGGIVGNEVFIVDYVFTRDNTDITIPLCAELLNRYDVKYCRVESNSMGAMFSRNLQKETKCKLLQVHNTKNKITRIIMESAFIINKFTFVEQNKTDYHLFMANLTSFSKEGKNKNDDAPDCLAGLSILIKSLFKNVN